MTTAITLRATKGSALTHAEMDANLTNLQTTADAAKAASDTLTADKAEAAALGVSNTDQNMGSFTGSTIADNVSAKAGMQALETAVEARPTSAALAASSGSSLVGFLQSGASAVARPAQSKMREAITVLDNDANNDGTTNTTTALASAVTDYGGKEILLPSGGYVNRTQLTLPASTSLRGDGVSSILKTDTASNHLILTTAANVRVSDMKLQGIQGSTVLNNSGVVFSGSGATGGSVDRVEMTGMSGYALYATGGASDFRLSFSYVHGQTGSEVNSCSVGLYQDAHNGLVIGSKFESGAGTQMGVLCQLNSTKHKVLFNRASGFTTYGLVSYDTVDRRTDHLFLGNTVSDIDGATLGGTSGAGIYGVATGGNIYAFNHVTNTNISTTTETLAPAGIGINSPAAPELIIGNQVNAANWYGSMLVSSPDVITAFADNVYFECLRMPVYIKASSHALVTGGSIQALTTTPLTKNGIGVNVAGGGPFTGVTLALTRIRGTGIAAVDVQNTNNVVILGHNISETAAIGVRLISGSGGVITGEVIDTSGNTAASLAISNFTYGTVTACVLKTGGTKAITIAGTCTGTRIDKSVVIVGQANPMNFIENNGTGCVVEAYGTGPPTLLQHQVGDTVWNSAPAVGQPIGWKCDTAGVPGNWPAMANL